MRANQAVFRVAAMCRMLGVSSSGYYAWLNREPSARERQDMVLTKKIRDYHRLSRYTYGAPRIQADLTEEGIRIGHNRVARLMKAAGLVGVSRRKGTRTTIRDCDARPAPDLVDRDFRATAPDQLWVADITYIPTWAGFLYLAVVLDAFNRAVVGWSIRTA